jgi:chromosome partitioning protein
VQRNVRLSEAPSFGKPVILYDATCIGARNYISLAREIIHGSRAFLEKAEETSEINSGESYSRSSAAANG